MNTLRFARACSWPMNSDEPLRPQRSIRVIVAFFGSDKAAGAVHFASSFSPCLISVAVSAPSPALRAAAAIAAAACGWP